MKISLLHSPAVAVFNFVFGLNLSLLMLGCYINLPYLREGSTHIMFWSLFVGTVLTTAWAYVDMRNQLRG
ncbi:hypothetical protein L1281_002498 [Neisseria sp. HSC-16F19]|nr:hypothetical protein [Neisseria sp. HSC-16F19]MCP2041880.1 hypothetical protein [Neisseria sp. HSC-16F19]